jgi:hypothetical protein
VLERLDPRTVDEAELRAVDPELHTLFNVNTPEDQAARRASGSGVDLIWQALIGLA